MPGVDLATVHFDCTLISGDRGAQFNFFFVNVLPHSLNNHKQVFSKKQRNSLITNHHSVNEDVRDNDGILDKEFDNNYESGVLSFNHQLTEPNSLGSNHKLSQLPVVFNATKSIHIYLFICFI